MSLYSSIRNTGVAEVMVVLKEEAPGAAATARFAEALKRHFHRSEYSRDEALLRSLRSTRSIMRARAAGRTNASSIASVKSTAPPSRYYPHLGILFGTVDEQGLTALRSAKSVSKVLPAPDLRLIRPIMMAAARPKTGVTWGLRMLGIPELWDQGLTGKGILVGHLDTGVDGMHPALKGSVSAFAEFDALGNIVPRARPKDSEEHGTHTAGTIVGRAVRGVSFGVAPEAKLASAMVIEGGHVMARILAGIDWCIGQNVRILNMSLGLPGYDEMFRPITQILRKRGILPVFAIGNEGPGTSRYPGNYPEALSVGAIDAYGEIADFSSSQRFKRAKASVVPSLVAPGVEVLSCTPKRGYKLMSGTSMATPHIAGLAALLLHAAPSTPVDKLEAAIFASCKRSKKLPKNRANRGLPYGPDALTRM